MKPKVFRTNKLYIIIFLVFVIFIFFMKTRRKSIVEPLILTELKKNVQQCVSRIENMTFLVPEDAEITEIDKKYEKTVQLHLEAFRGAGLGNKIFELMTLIGIGDTLQRRVLVNATDLNNIRIMANKIQPIFPKIQEEFEFKLIPTAAATRQDLSVGKCCTFDDPKQFINRPEKHLIFDGRYFQSFKYFNHIRLKIRELLKPKDQIFQKAECLLPERHRKDFIFSAPSSTFGWWLSYLSKEGSVTYYRNIMETQDKVANEMKEDDFYPPEWIKLRYDNVTGRIDRFF
ncbi:hypothetical protein CRE_05237 [Caenorhabditis remanei]|uniref:Uncharacterized protein n=1 Tax=Caenorhabditis remanei TaxID=31234 RepID=E3NGU6_CAERE|nr:hypothetical protein CRE_05237 [Caenorhabditis remanei]